MDITRGGFYLADLNPRRGTEPGKTRPVLVIQTDLLTGAGHPSCIILPLTTQIQNNAEPLRVHIPANHPGFDIASDVMIDQIRAIDNQRLYRGDTNELIKKISLIDQDILRDIERCLLLVLDLNHKNKPY
jgi:mRNA interferase MazF